MRRTSDNVSASPTLDKGGVGFVASELRHLRATEPTWPSERLRRSECPLSTHSGH